VRCGEAVLKIPAARADGLAARAGHEVVFGVRPEHISRAQVLNLVQTRLCCGGRDFADVGGAFKRQVGGVDAVLQPIRRRCDMAVLL
jgi:MalK OB fold domain